ncbi:helix-turn-helix domain-containing protein [Rhizobium lusitanum]|uniref:Helix-turn-helix domain-containing protein n=1 Tax=Rhizobium lusitanum TaxID=293958 RepID=A0A6L9U8Z7_9HYPH|nr:IclR family transcriptional regulator [Rhizobium lusitanum]NEI72425.1 helix-turn-helix domain-containing protein [Rhizobium lusitanum]
MSRATRDPIAKALEAIVQLVESSKQQVGVRELAASMQISPSSAHRILLKLVDTGFVAQERDSQRYSLGVEFFRIAQLSSRKLSLRDISLPAMQRIAKEFNETVLLAVYDPARRGMFFSASVESTHPLRYVIEMNKWMAIHASASGFAILAFLSDEEVETIINQTHLSPLTANSITNAAEVRLELAKVRRQGYALSRGQRIPGAVGLAVPIFDSMHQVVGDICVTIPEQRFDSSQIDPLLQAMRRCVRDIEEKIGSKLLSP